MEWGEILKLYGPQAIPWMALAYFGKWHLDRLDKDIENRAKMAATLDGMAKVLEKVYDRLNSVKIP